MMADFQNGFSKFSVFGLISRVIFGLWMDFDIGFLHMATLNDLYNGF